MFEYHGWLAVYAHTDAGNIEKRLIEMNDPYPASTRYVNGQLHIAFSGNPNRELNYIEQIMEYLLSLKLDLYGIIYIHNTDTDRSDRFDVIKVVKDKQYSFEDRNFSPDETGKLFE
jgi:hypothetical protein